MAPFFVSGPHLRPTNISCLITVRTSHCLRSTLSACVRAPTGPVGANNARLRLRRPPAAPARDRSGSILPAASQLSAPPPRQRARANACDRSASAALRWPGHRRARARPKKRVHLGLAQQCQTPGPIAAHGPLRRSRVSHTFPTTGSARSHTPSPTPQSPSPPSAPRSRPRPA
jgi:hypothetical protein